MGWKDQQSPDEEPLSTRWSFEDFEQVYEAFFSEKDCILNSASSSDNATSDSQSPSINSSVTDNQIENTSIAAGTQMTDGDVSANSSKKKTMKPPLQYYTAELRDLAEGLMRDIVKTDLDVRWDDVKGLDTAKRLLREAVVMPIKYPQYFKGLLSPWKGILLFGPPGTGKTMLAKAVATECNTTFFNISASSVVSKWRGDSEKLIRVLFELARHHAPSTIFLDELDSIISQRGDGPEHEASRRMKTELLVQMDGLARTSDLVFVLAATNLPWELDSAMLRRLEKRILVPLPDAEARRAIFEALLPTKDDMTPLYNHLVETTAGYSGSDIRLVCKEAAMRPLRRLMTQLESIESDTSNEGEIEFPDPGPITEEDAVKAVAVTKSSAHALTSQYKRFEEEFGSHTM